MDDATDPSTWDPDLDAVKSAPKHHRVIFENDNLRVLEVALEPGDEEPVHHHRWPSVFVLDRLPSPIHTFAPDGSQPPPDPDAVLFRKEWDGTGCIVAHLAPQPAGSVVNASGETLHGIRIEMKTPAAV